MKGSTILLLAVAVALAFLLPSVRAFAGDCAVKLFDATTAHMQRSGLMLGMAEFASRQKTNLAANKKIPPYDQGRVTVAVATTPAVAAWAQNDTWGTGIRIPKGSRILRSGRLSHGVFGASVTLDLGLRNWDTGAVVDVDGIADGLDVAAAGVKELDGGSLTLAGISNVTTEDCEVYATLLGANPTDNAQAEVEIHWIGPVA